MTTTTPGPTASPATSAAPPVCSAPEGYRLSYVLTGEAWYSRPPLTGIPGDRNVLMISMDNLDGGCRWEFAIDDEPGGLRLGVYDDAWQAFAAVPEFFTALTALGRGALVEEVVEILDALGFTDTTPRVPADPATRAAFQTAQQRTQQDTQPDTAQGDGVGR